MGVRYNDSATGAFLSRDPLWPRLEAVAELSPYVYTGGRPTWRIDPQGTDSEKHVFVWGNKYWFWGMGFIPMTHNGLYFEFPDERFNHSIDINAYNKHGGAMIVVQQHPYQDAWQMPVSNQDPSHRTLVDLGECGYLLRVDEALAIMDMFEAVQTTVDYGIGGGMTDFGQADYIYCWQSADMMKDFQGIYGTIHDAVQSYQDQTSAPGEFRGDLEPLRQQITRRLGQDAQIAATRWGKMLNKPGVLENLIVYAETHLQRQRSRQGSSR